MRSLDLHATSRVTCTIPLDVVNVVDRIADRVGCTRSAVIAQLLSSSCWDLLEVAESSLPKRRQSGAISRRASGRSAAELGAIFDDLQERLTARDDALKLSAELGFTLDREVDGE